MKNIGQYCTSEVKMPELSAWCVNSDSENSSTLAISLPFVTGKLEN